MLFRVEKKLLTALAGLGLFLAVQSCFAASTPPPSSDSQGTLFIREKAVDVKTFQTAFQNSRADFKANGFLAYSLHTDLQDPSFIILTLQCSNLAKGLAFLKTDAYKTFMKTAGTKDSVVWSGADITPRVYGDLPPKPAGIVIARNDLKSYDYWKAVFDAEHNPAHGGKNPNKESGYHEKRDYKASHYSIHRGLEKADVAYVVHEASDISKAPEFMTSTPMKAMKGPLGITRFTVWYGVNLEQGTF
jgi:quinol monooxygenase YgiN